MHVHFVAVAGTGMGALAGLFKALGHEVSGSDTAFYPPMGPALEQWGIRLFEGFDAAHLVPRPDLVVIGNVCRPANVEARAAIDGGLRTTSMAHALADHVLDGTSPLVVSGTHGKTTTSALAAFVLSEVGRTPGFLIGGIPKDFDSSFRPPSRGRLPLMETGALRKPPFVVEGDEYDTAFFEKTPKFWHYRPDVAIVTSIEHDHIDIYPNRESYEAAFAGFLARVPESGLVVANAADRAVFDLVSKHAKATVAWYALEGEETHGAPPHWLAAPATATAEGQSFDVYAGGVAAGRAAISLPGVYNVKNALAALAAATQGYGARLDRSMAALSRFSGVKRRQELLFEARGVKVYDDFAHHPTAVAETLQGLRDKHARGALFAVFEPRSATACRALHQVAYESAFTAADQVILAPLGRTDIPESERLDLERIARAIESRGKRALVARSIEEIVDEVSRLARAGDTVALLSNGAFGGIYEKLRRALG